MPHYLKCTSPVHPPLRFDDAALRDSIAARFEGLQLRERLRVLRRLLVPVGPMALLVIAGGRFAKYVRQARSPRMKLSPDDAANLTPAQLVELARYAEQSQPSALAQVMHILDGASARFPTPRASFPAPCCP